MQGRHWTTADSSLMIDWTFGQDKDGCECTKEVTEVTLPAAAAPL
jgi:hypothetical protein